MPVDTEPVPLRRDDFRKSLELLLRAKGISMKKIENITHDEMANLIIATEAGLLGDRFPVDAEQFKHYQNLLTMVKILERHLGRESPILRTYLNTVHGDLIARMQTSKTVTRPLAESIASVMPSEEEYKEVKPKENKPE
jgi:hypothetical protein